MAGQREGRQRNPWHRPLILFITCLFGLVIIGLVTTAVVQNKRPKQKYKYGIVLDAGSSHTGVYIYRWPAEKENNTGMVEQVHVCNVKGPGISSYAGNPIQAGASLDTCMDEAQTKIPITRHPETPVYLGATAGMRLLRVKNKTASDEVLSSVHNYLSSTPFSYEGSRIITGQEEGAYGWITVNYLSENFQHHRTTMGALDLGGASTQITFVSGMGSEVPADFMHFRLYGNKYQVYTHSFLCYGKDQALRLTLNSQLQTGNRILHEPCFHPGYTNVKSLEELYSSSCLPHIRPVSGSFTINGTGNWTACRSAIHAIFNMTHCSSSSCSFNGIFQPPLEGHFGAFSAFFFVMDFLNLTTNSLEESKRMLQTFCSIPWNEIKGKYPGIKEKYLSEYCFSGTYIITLLEDGYRFTSESWKNIEFIKKIGRSDAGWTLGYMLNLTNMIPAEDPDGPPLSYGGYVCVMLVLSLLLPILLFLGCRFFRRPVNQAQKQIV